MKSTFMRTVRFYRWSVEDVGVLVQKIVVSVVVMDCWSVDFVTVKANMNVKDVGVKELKNVDIVVVMEPKQKLRRMMKVMKLKWKLNV